MARQIIEKVTDDINGDEGAKTVEFALDGIRYSIDLGEKNADKLRKALDPYVAKATRVGKTAGFRIPSPTQRRNSKVDNKAIRAWALENGWEDLSARGRIPQQVIDDYNAHGGHKKV